MDNIKKKVITGAVAVAVLVAGYLTYEHFAYVTTDNAQVFGHSVMLAPKVSGYIKAVNVVEGQKVNAGDVLVNIDPRDYENTLKQAKGAVSQQQFDSSSAQYHDFKAKYEAIASQVPQAELNLANTNITAPANGFIAKKSVEVGQLAAPGIPLIGFVDSGERWIIANFKETEVEGIKLNAQVDITIDAISGKSYTGKVESISSATGATFTLLPPDNATGNFTKVVQRIPVKIKFENISEEDVIKLRTGLSAFIKVHKH